MIGGTDVVLEVKPGVSPAEVICRVVGRHWPHCVYLNADDESAPLPLPKGTTPPGLAPEFFLHQDEESVRSWDEFGATPENRNTTLYVLLPKAGSPEPQELTVVCGELVGDMAALMAEIEAELSAGTKAKHANGEESSGGQMPGAAVRE
jgi:hypothetical protein